MSATKSKPARASTPLKPRPAAVNKTKTTEPTKEVVATPKPATEQVATAKPDETGAQAKTAIGVTATPTASPSKSKRVVVRAQIFGHPVTAVLRWMGANAWTFEQARAALEEFGAGSISDTTVRIQLPAGKKGERGPAAPITKDQAAQLQAAAKSKKAEG